MAEYNNDDPRDPSFHPNTTDGDVEWVTDEEVKSLAMERDTFGTDYVEQAERILKENLPIVVHSVVKLARLASSETVRLNAAKYVIDRNLGRITEPEVQGDDALRDLYKDVTVS